MPERIGNSNVVYILEGEEFTTSDGNSVKGPIVVRIFTFDKDVLKEDLIRVQADYGKSYEVTGRTIEDFIASVHHHQ